MLFEKVTEIIKSKPSYALLTDLTNERLGGRVLFATDDFFAEKENLIKPGRGIFIADKYTDRGKWMDGWESRRKRTPGNDWCVIQLANPGRISGFDIDTNFFLGNHPPHASVDGIYIEKTSSEPDWSNENLPWKELLPKSPLDPGSQNFYPCSNNETFTHIRLHIYPDGGVARLKVYGEVVKSQDFFNTGQEIDLAAAINGGKTILCNDMFFSDMNNLIMPGRGVNMGDGWETKRNRTPNNKDWVILKSAKPGVIHKIIVDTCHFKGNYPDSCSIEGCLTDDDESFKENKLKWETILPQQKLSPHLEHEFVNEIKSKETYSHVRLNIFPDGGISRLRLFGIAKTS